MQKTEKLYLNLGNNFIFDNHTKRQVLFADGFDYSNPSLPDAGRNIPRFGLKIRVIDKSDDHSVAKIFIYK